MAVFFREGGEGSTVEGEFSCLPCIARGKSGKILPDAGKTGDNGLGAFHARLPVLGAIDTVHGAAGEGQKDRMDVFGPFLLHPKGEACGTFIGWQCFLAGIF